jgi:hypothetical protein
MTNSKTFSDIGSNTLKADASVSSRCFNGLIQSVFYRRRLHKPLGLDYRLLSSVSRVYLPLYKIETQVSKSILITLVHKFEKRYALQAVYYYTFSCAC